MKLVTVFVSLLNISPGGMLVSKICAGGVRVWPWNIYYARTGRNMFIRWYFIRSSSNSVSTEHLHYKKSRVPEVTYCTQENNLFQSDIRASATYAVAEFFRKNYVWKYQIERFLDEHSNGKKSVFQGSLHLRKPQSSSMTQYHRIIKTGKDLEDHQVQPYQLQEPQSSTHCRN